LSVFNRIGEKVYESNNINEGWDGNYKGALATPGVYVYTLKVVFDDNTTRNFKGSVTLLR
jgi:gliding motility-associated-like protein